MTCSAGGVVVGVEPGSAGAAAVGSVPVATRPDGAVSTWGALGTGAGAVCATSGIGAAGAWATVCAGGLEGVTWWAGGVVDDVSAGSAGAATVGWVPVATRLEGPVRGPGASGVGAGVVCATSRTGAVTA